MKYAKRICRERLDDTEMEAILRRMSEFARKTKMDVLYGLPMPAKEFVDAVNSTAPSDEELNDVES